LRNPATISLSNPKIQTDAITRAAIERCDAFLHINEAGVFKPEYVILSIKISALS